jgi:hypothetical protein
MLRQLRVMLIGVEKSSGRHMYVLQTPASLLLFVLCGLTEKLIIGKVFCVRST